MIGQRRRIEKILEGFDFRKAKDALLACDLVWQDEEGTEYIPSQKEIKERAKTMLNNAVNTKTTYCKISFGNLVVKKCATSLELTLVIESASA